jgi:hypothetical protein
VEVAVLHVLEVQRVRLTPQQQVVFPASVLLASLVITIIVEHVEPPVQEDKRVKTIHVNVRLVKPYALVNV